MTKSFVSSEDKLLEDICFLMDSSDCPPWQKPWAGHAGNHRNLITAHEYRGANPLLLELGMMLRDSTTPIWIGSAHARAEGWHPKKGSRSVRILRPQLNQRDVLDDEGNQKLDSNGEPEISAWVSYKVVPVFNVSDIQGSTTETQADLEHRIQEAIGQVKASVDDKQRVHQAEAGINAWSVPVKHGGAMACYSSQLDRIMLPKPEAFTSRETYLATKLHEIAHSTGHSSRLKRPLGNGFGTKAYAREELIAEFSSVLTCLRLGIGYELEHHASYLKSWAKHLKEGGSKELLKVLSEARQAADLIAPEHGLSAL